MQMPPVNKKERRFVLVALMVLAMMLVQFLALDWGPGTFASAAKPDDSFELFQQNSGFYVNALDFAPDGSVLLVGNYGGISSYSPSKGTFTELQPASQSYNNNAVDHSSSGEALVVGASGNAVSIDSNHLKHPKTVPVTKNLKGIAWRHDGTYAIIVGDSGTLLIYNVSSPTLDKLNNTTVAGYDSLGISGISLTAIDWAPNNNFAIITGADGRVFKLVEIAKAMFVLTEISAASGGAAWNSVAISPDSSKALVGGDAGSVYLLETTNWQPTVLNIPGSGYNIISVAWKDQTSAYILGLKSGNKNGFYKYSGVSNLEDVTAPYTTGYIYADALAFNASSPGGTIGMAAGTGFFRYPNSAPAAPTVTLSSKQLTTLTIDYNKSTEADFWKYEYYISLTKGFTPDPTSFAGNQTNKGYSQYTFSGLQEAKTYYIRVKVCDFANLCTASAEFMASTVDMSHPTPVTVTMGTVDYTTAALSWTQFTDLNFAGYEVHKGSTTGFTPGTTTNIMNITSIGTTTYTVTGLLSGSTYYFKVRVYNTNKYYGDSNEVAVKTPQAPLPDAVTLHYQGINADSNQPQMEWSVAKTTDFAKYEIHYSTSSGFVISPATLFYVVTDQGTPGGTNSYVITMDTSNVGKSFYFKVRVVDKRGGYADSNEVSFVYSQRPEQMPQVHTKDVSAHSVTVYWTKPSSKPADFDHYKVVVQSMKIPDQTAANINDFGTTSYTVTGLKANTQYYITVSMVNKKGNAGDPSTSAQFTTQHDAVGDFFSQLQQPECLCSGGPFALVMFIAILVTLQTKYKAKGVLWAIPLIISFGIVLGVSFLNFAAELKLPTWYFQWVLVTGILGSITLGIITLVVVKTSSSGRTMARNAAIAAAPILIGLLIIYIVIVNNDIYLHVKGMKTYPTSFFLPLLIVCIIGSVGIVVGRAALARARAEKWRQEEAERAYQKRLQEFRTKKATTEDKLKRLEARVDMHKDEAPAAMYNDVNRYLRDGWRAFQQAQTVDQAQFLDPANVQAENAEKTIVDIEAYIISKQQAKEALDSLKARTDSLSTKRAPKVEAAIGVYRDAKKRLDEAQTVIEVRSVVEVITKANTLCDESATSLKGAEEQLADLKVQLSQVSSRLTDIRDNQKEKESVIRLGALVSGINAIIIAQTAKPDIDDLAKGREQVRAAKELIQQVDERERQRQTLLTDIENLKQEMDETATWSSEKLDEIGNTIERAQDSLEKDDLENARIITDEGFGQLEMVRGRSIPRLVLVDKEYEPQVDKWAELDVELKNEGNADAQDIDFEVNSPSAQLQEVKDKVRSTYRIRPGDTTMVPIKIQFTAEGAVPITFLVTYKDALNNDYSEELPLRVNVLPKMILREPEAPAKKVTEDYGLRVVKRGDIAQGLYKFKVSLQNKGSIVVREANFRLIYDKKTFHLHHVYPSDLKLIGDSVDYGDIEPGTTRSAEFYLEAHMCTETKLDGVITFKDIQGRIQTSPMETWNVTFVCPTFIDVSDISPAQVKELINADGWKQDTKTYAVPSNLDLQFIFDTMKQAIERFETNLKHVFDDCQEDPISMESWYYGETKAEAKGSQAGEGVQHIVIGKVTRVQRAGSTLLIIGASPHQGQLFALSSRLGVTISDAITKAANLSRPIQQIFQTVEIRDSVLTGSTIQMGGAAAAAEGTGAEATGKVSVTDSVMVRSEIAGGKEVDVKGSVVQRTKMGGQGPSEPRDTCPIPDQVPQPKSLDPMREFSYKVYRDMLRQVYEDGQVTVDERNMLKRLRSQLSLSMDEHSALEEEILAEREAKQAKDGKKL